MADKTNAPRDQRRASQNTNQTTSQRTRDFDPSRCDEGCGPCWETFFGTERWCEVEHVRTLRRDLAKILDGGGDDA